MPENSQLTSDLTSNTVIDRMRDEPDEPQTAAAQSFPASEHAASDLHLVVQQKEILAGRSVTLEHVPLRVFKREFGINSMLPCVTCANRNNTLCRQADHVAGKALQDLKVHIEVRGISHAG